MVFVSSIGLLWDSADEWGANFKIVHEKNKHCQMVLTKRKEYEKNATELVWARPILAS